MPSEYLLDAIRSIPPRQFGQFVADVWGRCDYQTELADADAVDVRATRDHPYSRTELIQIGRYAGSDVVESLDTRRHDALARRKDADCVVVVTTSQFAEDLRTAVDDVRLVDGPDLANLVSEASLYDVLAAYAPIETTVEQRIVIEHVADDIVAATALSDPEPIADSLRAYFESHPSPPDVVQPHSSLYAFTRDGDQNALTELRWEGVPSIDVHGVADAVLDGASDPESRPHARRSSVPEARRASVESAVAAVLNEALKTPPDEMGQAALADWIVDRLDGDLIPVDEDDPGRIRAAAEDVVDPSRSVAVNRLRVGERLERGFETGDLGH